MTNYKQSREIIERLVAKVETVADNKFRWYINLSDADQDTINAVVTGIKKNNTIALSKEKAGDESHFLTVGILRGGGWKGILHYTIHDLFLLLKMVIELKYGKSFILIDDAKVIMGMPRQLFLLINSFLNPISLFYTVVWDF